MDIKVSTFGGRVMKVKCKCKICGKEWKVRRSNKRQVKEIKRNKDIVICNECDDMSNEIMFGTAIFYK